MAKKIQSILKEVLNKVNPPKEDLDRIDKFLVEFKDNFQKEIKN